MMSMALAQYVVKKTLDLLVKLPIESPKTEVPVIELLLK